ncbi:hypothetical protein B0H21DRAFT_93090 [Amylocystis lapponica]|nr:hypothetical protein B0H21DRAFT_93090 [Amylocystis lapponica]
MVCTHRGLSDTGITNSLYGSIDASHSLRTHTAVALCRRIFVFPVCTVPCAAAHHVEAVSQQRGGPHVQVRSKRGSNRSPSPSLTLQPSRSRTAAFLRLSLLDYPFDPAPHLGPLLWQLTVRSILVIFISVVFFRTSLPCSAVSHALCPTSGVLGQRRQRPLIAPCPHSARSVRGLLHRKLRNCSKCRSMSVATLPQHLAVEVVQKLTRRVPRGSRTAVGLFLCGTKRVRSGR